MRPSPPRSTPRRWACTRRWRWRTAPTTPSTDLEVAPAAFRAAAARERAVVLRFAIVGGELLAGRDGPPRVELRARGRAADERVRVARVIDEAKAAPRARRVDGVPLELDDGHDPRAGRAAPRLAKPDHFSLELADLGALRDRHRRVEAPPHDAASPHVQFFVEAPPTRFHCAIIAQNEDRLEKMGRLRAAGRMARRGAGERSRRLAPGDVRFPAALRSAHSV